MGKNDKAEVKVSDAERDDITKRYLELVCAEMAAQDEADGWQSILESPQMKKFTEKMRTRQTVKRASWDNIEAKEFMESRAEVRALTGLLEELEREGIKAITAHRDARQYMVAFETANALLLRPPSGATSATDAKPDFEAAL